ncbi:Reticulon [Cynara cardunculus var. scolymus]|uniref:Reticulon-like protein n=1 Tax=Cynara cardunculus var. scolymus TaxID=59895 RepID=A0A103YMF9_CYNCS|nr:Reticulon [Cynara cardunculus var. scolymus]
MVHEYNRTTITKPTAISSSQSHYQQSNSSMDLERKRVAANSSRNGVVMGSVWESRMKGSFKVFNGDDKNMNQTQEMEKPTETETTGEMEKVGLRSKQSSNGVGGGVGKRKTWKSDGGSERIPAQIPKVRSENKKMLSELSKELSVSMDGNGIKKSPVQMKKERLEWNKEQSVSIERSPVQRTTKTRSLSRIGSTTSDLSDGIERVKSLPTTGTQISIDSNHGVEEIEGEYRDDKEMKNNRSDSSQSLDELGVVCEEKQMTDDLRKDISPQILDAEDYEEDELASNKATMEENEEINEERSIVVVKEMEPISTISKKKSPDVVIEEKKIHQRNERSNPVSRTIRKQPPPVVNHPRIISKPSKYSAVLESHEFPSQRVPRSHSKLHSFMDLIMWRDASKSALIFGFGTFSILSSSYTQDLNISFISVISYLGLIYLAAIFIFRSFIYRGVVEADNITDDEECVLGEEEAIWALKLFLPYINEFLLKIKALFSGDPATTMKVIFSFLFFIFFTDFDANFIFICNICENVRNFRCHLTVGSSAICFGKMWQLHNHLEIGENGFFWVPKICSSYSSQLTAYGTFWVRRFKDAWESCSQKKAVAIGVFTLVWNLSSIIARTWAVFMLLVAFKYYQQSMMKNEDIEEEVPTQPRNQSSWQEQRNAKVLMPKESKKLRKRT